MWHLFPGDLLDEQRVLSWLTSQDVFEIKDEIEEVNRKMLEKILEENEFVAVYFCKFYISIRPKTHYAFFEQFFFVFKFLFYFATKVSTVKKPPNFFAKTQKPVQCVIGLSNGTGRYY